ALPAPAWLGSVHFVPAPPGVGGYRVALSFMAGATPGAITVEATFRSATQAVSMVRAQGPAGTGPTDPAFRQLMSEVMLTLLPPTGSGRPGGSGGSGGSTSM